MSPNTNNSQRALVPIKQPSPPALIEKNKDLLNYFTAIKKEMVFMMEVRQVQWAC